MQMKIGIVQLLFVHCKTSVFTDYLSNFRRTVVIFTHKVRLVDTQVNPIPLAIYFYLWRWKNSWVELVA